METIKAIIASLHEFNPMMGHRGCRLAVTYPEIATMQTKAVIRAALKVKAAHPDWPLTPEIMIPLVGDVKELKNVKDVVVKTADAEIAAAGIDLKYAVGTMIEIPRACLTAASILRLWPGQNTPVANKTNTAAARKIISPYSHCLHYQPLHY